jgi:acetyltransferase-like isoleucine patch superfamily enzyme
MVKRYSDPTVRRSDSTVSGVDKVVRRLNEMYRLIRTNGSLRVALFYPPGLGPRAMSQLRKRWVLFRNPHARIEFRGPVYLGPGFSLHMPRGGTLIVGPDVEFRRGFRAEFTNGDTRITIGEGCRFTYDIIIQCTTSIDIGERGVFAAGTMLVDGSHRFRDLGKSVLDQGYDFRPLTIGGDVTVSSKCTVIADIGEHAFVGANAVVVKPVPPYCLAAGVPARVIEYFGPAGMEPPEDGGP